MWTWKNPLLWGMGIMILIGSASFEKSESMQMIVGIVIYGGIILCILYVLSLFGWGLKSLTEYYYEGSWGKAIWYTILTILLIWFFLTFGLDFNRYN